ncbi:ArsB/NhaD family transporter [Dialister invisus]|uniref:SLC13 family permease n=1 Tax=Dialister invisus TaxID=218538 RepID=UPI003078E045
MSSSVQFYLAIFIFLMTYVGIMSEKIHRTICALAGGGAMIYFGLVTQEQAITEFIDFNTLGLLTGMMILISVVKQSGFFQVLALWALKKSKGSPRELLILLSIVTAVGAALIDSVTAALLIAPMTISLCRMLRMSPVPILISEILMCNIGGTALMIGNPPNVMIGSATHLDFNDFLMNLAPVVFITVIVILIAVLLIFKNDFSSVRMSAEELEKIDIMSGVEDKSIFSRSLMVLALTVLGFVVHSRFGLESATVAMTGGMAALLFCGINPEDALKEVDLDTLMFFMGLFILVGGMENAGVITAIAEKGIEMVDGDSHLITFLILLLSGVASAFVDNIPFTATMIPLIQDMQSLMNLPHADYMWWALATGACFGGNGTMIGASPNVIMVAIAAKEGFNISFTAFMKWCFPLMLLSLFVAGCYLETRYFIFGM